MQLRHRATVLRRYHLVETKHPSELDLEPRPSIAHRRQEAACGPSKEVRGAWVGISERERSTPNLPSARCDTRELLEVTCLVVFRDEAFFRDEDNPSAREQVRDTHTMIPFGDTTTLDVDHDPSTRCFSLQAHANICCVTNPPPRGKWGFHDRSPGAQRAVTAKRVHRKIPAAQTHCEHGGWRFHGN